jgi:hypothetical protein
VKDLNKENLLQAVSPYSFCERQGDINKLTNFQYLRIATEFERNLSFESFGIASNLLSNSCYRKIPNIDLFKLDNLNLFGHGMLCLNNEKVLVCDELHIWPNRSNSKINSAIFNYDVDNSNLIRGLGSKNDKKSCKLLICLIKIVIKSAVKSQRENSGKFYVISHSI